MDSDFGSFDFVNATFKLSTQNTLSRLFIPGMDSDFGSFDFVNLSHSSYVAKQSIRCDVSALFSNSIESLSFLSFRMLASQYAGEI